MEEIDVIRWKLNEVMARNRVRNKDLAEILDITENSVYRLRKAEEMPRLTPQRLNGICAALGCQPGELLEWVPDEDEQTISARRALQSLAQFHDQILALSWKGYRQFGPGAVTYINQPDGPEIGYLERDRLPDAECFRVVNATRPEHSAIVLYFYGNDYDTSNYSLFTLSGPKSPPDCYYDLYPNE
jgi:putative transcriptional regulator